jgi:hypothetical protein
MGVLKIKEANLEKKSSVVKLVLDHFDRVENKYKPAVLEQISAAADNVFGDEILFEEFENWVSTHDDDTFIFLVNHYWEGKTKKPLAKRGDLTGENEKILSIKDKSKMEVGKKFASILNNLCAKKNLKNLKEIGDFLGGLSEERVRVLLEGKHKPQRATILMVADKFQVDPSELMNEIINL